MTVVYALAAWALLSVLFAGCFIYPVAVSELIATRAQQKREATRLGRTV